MGLSPERKAFVRANAVVMAEGSTHRPLWPGRRSLTGVCEQGTCAPGSLRNPRGLSPPSEKTAWVQRRPGPGRWNRHRVGGHRSEQAPDRRYRLPRETGGAETGAEESEHSIVPMSSGNPPQGTRRREGGAVSPDHRRER